jgi:hypothetical protein
MRFFKIIFIVFVIIFFIWQTGCSKKKEAETQNLIEEKMEELEQPLEKPEIPQEAKTEPKKDLPSAKEPVKPVDQGPSIYTLQVLSVTDIEMAKILQEQMAKNDVKAKISEFVKDNETYYRLRLDGRYTKYQAEQLGERLKNQFWGISDYWVVRAP